MERVEHLIIGSGYAGDTAAATLRKAGAQGRVLVVGAEPEYPYQRYQLSKEFLKGRRSRERVFLHPTTFYEEQGIELRLGKRALHLDVHQRKVGLDTGEEVSYERLLLATGASVRLLAIPGADLPGVYSLRTLADSEALRQEMHPGRRVVIIGGGFIGAEVASAFTASGLSVTIVDIVPILWAHLFGEEMGRLFHQYLQEKGVNVMTPGHAARLEGEGRVQRVAVAEGQTLPCDFVVIGVGVKPETALAEEGGLKVDGGIVANEYLETGAPGVYAAGDVARFWSPLFEEYLRVEHWDVAHQQGMYAAWNMLGQRRPFDEVPYFFSGLFDLWVEYLGHCPQWERLVIRRLARERFTAFYVRDSRIRGALLVNNSKELRPCRELIQEQRAIGDISSLEDPGLDLADLLRG